MTPPSLTLVEDWSGVGTETEPVVQCDLLEPRSLTSRTLEAGQTSRHVTEFRLVHTQFQIRMSPTVLTSSCGPMNREVGPEGQTPKFPEPGGTRGHGADRRRDGKERVRLGTDRSVKVSGVRLRPGLSLALHPRVSPWAPHSGLGPPPLLLRDLF